MNARKVMLHTLKCPGTVLVLIGAVVAVLVGSELMKDPRKDHPPDAVPPITVGVERDLPTDFIRELEYAGNTKGYRGGYIFLTPEDGSDLWSKDSMGGGAVIVLYRSGDRWVMESRGWLPEDIDILASAIYEPLREWTRQDIANRTGQSVETVDVPEPLILDAFGQPLDTSRPPVPRRTYGPSPEVYLMQLGLCVLSVIWMVIGLVWLVVRAVRYISSARTPSDSAMSASGDPRAAPVGPAGGDQG